MNSDKSGWKPIPLALKVLSVVLFLWAIGSIFAIPSRYQLGLPFLGFFIYGIGATLIVILLDIISPFIFLFGLWNRKSWAVPFAFTYIGIFIINGLVAMILYSAQLGLVAFLIPTTINALFLAVIYWKRSYFYSSRY